MSTEKKDKNVKQEFSKEEEDEIIAQLKRLGLTDEQCKAHLGLYSEKMSRPIRKMDKTEDKKDEHHIGTMSKEKLAEWKERGENMIQQMKSLRGNHKEANIIVDSIIKYHAPDPNDANANHMKHVMAVVDIGTWLYSRGHKGKKLYEYYRSVVGKTKIDEEGIIKFCTFCTDETDRKVRQEEVDDIMKKLFPRELNGPESIAFYQFRSNQDNTLNDVLKLNEFMASVTEMLKSYRTFHSDPTITAYRGCALALALLREDNICDMIMKYMRKKKDKGVTTEDLVANVLSADNITLSQWMDNLNPDKGNDMEESKEEDKKRKK